MIYIVTVSYTHLDVYKRQAFGQHISLQPVKHLAIMQSFSLYLNYLKLNISSRSLNYRKDSGNQVIG